jgi:argininosuccinate lyase
MSDVTELLGAMHRAGVSQADAAMFAGRVLHYAKNETDEEQAAAFVAEIRGLGVPGREAHRVVGRLLDIGYRAKLMAEDQALGQLQAREEWARGDAIERAIAGAHVLELSAANG